MIHKQTGSALVASLGRWMFLVFLLFLLFCGVLSVCAWQHRDDPISIEENNSSLQHRPEHNNAISDDDNYGDDERGDEEGERQERQREESVDAAGAIKQRCAHSVEACVRNAQRFDPSVGGDLDVEVVISSLGIPSVSVKPSSSPLLEGCLRTEAPSWMAPQTPHRTWEIHLRGGVVVSVHWQEQ